MNREILFRGKRIDNGEWVFGYLIGNDVIVGEIIEFEDEYFNCEFWWRVDPNTIGQFTGLLDKKGVKIFEGDIVADNSSLANTSFAIEWDLCRGSFSCGRLDKSLARCHEIIGNTTDNPELLKGKA